MNPSYQLLPPLPAWEHMHPLIVHLPLGVLMVAPALLLLAMFGHKARVPLAVAALVLVCLGALGAVLAAASGGAAEHAVTIPREAVATFGRHENLAELTRNLFLGLAGVYGVVVVLGAVLRDKLPRLAWIGVHVVYLALYAGGLLTLANAGHEGARLVHEFGVRAKIAGPAAGAAAPAAQPARAHETDKHD